MIGLFSQQLRLKIWCHPWFLSLSHSHTHTRFPHLHCQHILVTLPSEPRIPLHLTMSLAVILLLQSPFLSGLPTGFSTSPQIPTLPLHPCSLSIPKTTQQSYFKQVRPDHSIQTFSGVHLQLNARDVKNTYTSTQSSLAPFLLSSSPRSPHFSYTGSRAFVHAILITKHAFLLPFPNICTAYFPNL